MPEISVNGARLHYDEYGAGDEIVISMQWAFVGKTWHQLLAHPPLNAHVYTVVAREHPPSEETGVALGANSYPTFAEDVYGFARAMGIGRFVYTGVSHGGGIGWHLAVAHPEVLKGFVSIVGVPHDRSWPRAERRTAQRDAEAALRSFGIAETSDPERLAAREQLRERIRHPDPSARPIDHGFPFPDAKTNEDLAARLAAVRVPTLILQGALDGVSGPGQALLAATAVPRAKTVIWQDYGHLVASEKPRLVIEEFKLFLDELNR